LTLPRINQGQESPGENETVKLSNYGSHVKNQQEYGDWITAGAKVVRQFSRLGPCLVLGPLVKQTATRIYYRRRDGKEAWASRSSRLLVHVEPCPSCRDQERSQYPDDYWDCAMVNGRARPIEDAS
jgi:hypothetical protein